MQKERWMSATLILMVLATGPLGTVSAFEPVPIEDPHETEIRRLTAENRVLRDTIRQQAERLNALKAEIENLRRAAPPDPPQTGEATPPAASAEPVLYKHWGRSPAWVEEHYLRFRDKIAFVDGRYVDLGRSYLPLREVEAEPPDAESLLRHMPMGGATVLQILRQGTALIHRPWRPGTGGTDRGPALVSARLLRGAPTPDPVPDTPELLFHVTGLDTSRLVDGANIIRCLGPTAANATSDPWIWAKSLKLLYVGTHRYMDAEGATRTVASYRLFEPLSRGEFVRALASGFELVDYSGGPAPKPITGRPVP